MYNLPASDSVLSSYDGHYYELITTSLSFNDALTDAAQKTYNSGQGHLATITTQEEYDFVITTFVSLNYAWIGGVSYSSGGSFYWAAGPEAGQIADPSLISNFWEENQPDDQQDACIQFGNVNRFDDQPCAQANWYLVEYERKNMQGYARKCVYVMSVLFNKFLSEIASALTNLCCRTAPLLSFNGHYYEYITSLYYFHEALTIASEKINNGLTGHLATISTRAEFDFLTSAFPELQEVWIGASDSAVEGTFRWVAGPEAGQVMNMTNGMWAPGEPSKERGVKHCVQLWDHMLYDQDCNDVFYFLVEYEGEPREVDVRWCVCMRALVHMYADMVCAEKSRLRGVFFCL